MNSKSKSGNVSVTLLELGEDLVVGDVKWGYRWYAFSQRHVALESLHEIFLKIGIGSSFMIEMKTICQQILQQLLLLYPFFDSWFVVCVLCFFLCGPVVVYFLYFTLRSFAFQIYFVFAVFVYCFGKLIINYVVGPVGHVLRNEC